MEILGTVFVVFLILKLTGVILWSWWLVTAPLWLGAILVAIIYLFFWAFFDKIIKFLFNVIDKF